MDLQTKLSELQGIGSTLAKKLAYLNLFTIEDLLNHYPFRYDDFSDFGSITESKIGEKVTLQGEVWSIKNNFTRFGKIITKAVFNDGSSTLELTWFNSPWLTKSIIPGDRLQISGKISKYGSKLAMVVPVWEKIQDLSNLKTPRAIHTGRLVPIYPETYGLSSKWIRQKIADLLPKIANQIIDPLPDDIRENMLGLRTAINEVHLPQSWNLLTRARVRLSFDELFYIQLATHTTRFKWQHKQTVKPLKVEKKLVDKFIKRLPFTLTKAQKRVTDEIVSDLTKTIPMNRLVQGEVGSGKTVVAATAIYLVYLNKLKSVFMAPTEILAFQHFSTISNLLSPYGVKIGIYTGSRKVVHSKKSNELANNSDVIVGTHALLSEKLETPDIGLVVVDEQQRFGVEQRTLLRSKAKIPHFLTMTATPIPRTVALTLYGDLDMSVIDELPKGRKIVKTYVVPSLKRKDAYKFIEKKIKEGDQAYIITPLIELSETMITAKAATIEFERLKKDIFPNLRLGLLHGRLKSKEKTQVLDDFKQMKIDILVSTSVVEVGVDVTNATIMVIEGSERFGLSQLHQLRGRVGRGTKQSYCLLFTETENRSVVSRLKYLEKVYDGLKLAEFDLKIRGGGEIFGTRQSGRYELKIASMSDLSMLEKTKSAAEKLLRSDSTLDNYPYIKAKLSSLAPDIMPD